MAVLTVVATILILIVAVSLNVVGVSFEELDEARVREEGLHRTLRVFVGYSRNRVRRVIGRLLLLFISFLRLLLYLVLVHCLSCEGPFEDLLIFNPFRGAGSYLLMKNEISL